MTFLETIYASVYSKEFYASLLKRSIWFSVSYFIALSCIVGVLVAVFYTALGAGSFIRWSQGVADSLREHFPANSTVVISNGALTVSPGTRVEIGASKSLQAFFNDIGAGSLQHLAVFEGNTSFEAEHALFVVSLDALFVGASTSSVSRYALGDVPDVSLNAQSANALADRLLLARRFIPLFFLLGMFVCVLFAAGVHALFLLVWAGAASLAGLLFGRTAPQRDEAPVSFSLFAPQFSFAVRYRALLHASSFGLLFLPFVLFVYSPALPVYVLVGMPVSAALVLWKLK